MTTCTLVNIALRPSFVYGGRVAEGDGQGLRARKKLQTWRTIRAAALRLIEERGYDAVSVEDAAPLNFG